LLNSRKVVKAIVAETLDELSQTPVSWEIVKAFKDGLLTEEQIRRLIEEALTSHLPISNLQYPIRRVYDHISRYAVR
jgi:hypothetical protein